MSEREIINQESKDVAVDAPAGTSGRLSDEDILRILDVLYKGPKMVFLGNSGYLRSPEKIGESSF